MLTNITTRFIVENKQGQVGTEENWDSNAPKVGMARGILRKMIAIWNTIQDLILGNDPTDIMKHKGKKLSSSKLNNYLDCLVAKKSEFSSFNTYSVQDFTGENSHIDIILNQIEALYEDPKKTKLAIPLVLPALTFLEEKHVVMIFIDKHKNTIDYFDSKGVISQERLLEKGGNMSDVLNRIAGKMDEKSTKPLSADSTIQKTILINENARVIQQDCHHCGAYVSWFAQQRLEKDMQNVIRTGIDLKGIHAFRREMKKQEERSPEVEPDSVNPTQDLGFKADFDS